MAHSGSSLSVVEAQAFVENLLPLPITEVGTMKWMQQREKIEQLNIQAHHSVIANEDEFVVEAFISFEKIAVLIHELLVIETWKAKVYPLLKNEMATAMKDSIKPYMILYHEATIINLLECIYYHKDAIEASGDAILELGDYCHRKLNILNMRDEDDDIIKEQDKNKLLNQTEEEALEEQRKTIEFNCCMCSITVLRFLTDNFKLLPLSLGNRLLEKHDITISLVSLIERPPWVRRGRGKFEKYNNGKWERVAPEDRNRICQPEAQVWLALNNLIVDPEAARKYQYNAFRKETVLKLRRYLTELLIDQISVLTDLQHALEKLTIMDPPAVNDKNILVLDQVPEIRRSIFKNADWEKIAQTQAKVIFNETEDQKREEMKRLAKMFGDMMDLLGETPTETTVDIVNK